MPPAPTPHHRLPLAGCGRRSSRSRRTIAFTDPGSSLTPTCSLSRSAMRAVVTFERRISLDAVSGATEDDLVVL